VRAQPDDELPVIQPSKLGRLMFRQMVAQLLRHDTDVTARQGLVGRLMLLGEGLRYTLGRGTVPQRSDPVSVRVAFPDSEESGSGRRHRPRFSELESSFHGRNPEFNELFARYFRVKVQGIHFCGRAFYDMPVIDGFRSLALMYPATLWVARWRAAQAGRSVLRLQDVQSALAILDHNSGYSPALGLRSSRHRISQLAQLGQIAALCGWYSL
jgi:lysine-N-methylase